MEERTIQPRYPTGVKRIIALGSSSFIGILEDDRKVLKYPKVAEEEWDRFVLESRIYVVLGRHSRIVGYYGFDDRGIELDYMKMGSLRRYINDPDKYRHTTSKQKLKWCRQAAEALSFIHEKDVIHCDISTRNFLLDDCLDLKLSDFQGLYIDKDGVTHNGQALESTKSYLPRPGDYSDERSDLFALGCAFYEILTGHEPFPELDGLDDEEEIERRYRIGEFPLTEDVLCGGIVHKCWTLQYASCKLCLDDLVDACSL